MMDPFTVKPLDLTAVQENAAACGGRVVTVEDHYPEGGLGDAVLASPSIGALPSPLQSQRVAPGESTVQLDLLRTS